MGVGWNSALLFIFVFSLYFLTRSSFLDKWDSVQLAMGVREFNLWKHQSHPSGYPLYVFLAWLGSALWNWDREFSMHLVSCFGGALFVTSWFLIVGPSSRAIMLPVPARERRSKSPYKRECDLHGRSRVNSASRLAT